ncbi:hypothetical protein B0H10DRAFT_2222162 [Mycena sp. CBHHK59/15]|nr:hypothetical protein B0H10DRAFT_2222162 [Mycena sp. CBHHK59/15]
MSDYLNIELDASLFPGFSLGMLETMGHGDDAEYIYNSTNPIFSPTSPSIPFGNTINLPHGAIPSRQAHVLTDQAPTKTVASDKGNVGDDENQPVNHSAVKARAVFGGCHLLALGRAIVLKRPFFAPHKGVGDAWKDINQYLREHSFGLDVKYTTLQTKAKALIAYKKDPKCDDTKSVASVIEGDGDTAVLLASVLEAMETQYDDAKDKTDEAKLKLKEKSDEDRIAGNAIRDTSLRARKRQRSPSPTREDDTDDDTSTPRKSNPGLSSTPSIEIIEPEGSQRRSAVRWSGILNVALTLRRLPPLTSSK